MTVAIIEVRRPGREEQLRVITEALGDLDALGLTHILPTVRELLDRADQLDEAAEAVPSTTPVPDDRSLTGRLAAGELDAGEVSTMLESAATAEPRSRLRRMLEQAANACRVQAIEAARRVGDRLIERDLRPAVADALRAGDTATWEQLCGIADSLRAAGLLPCRLSATEIGRSFDSARYRRDEDGRPGVYSDEQVYRRAFPRRPDRSTVTTTGTVLPR